MAIWDANNGTETGININVPGTPSGWIVNRYWSATPSGSGHAYIYLNIGFVNLHTGDGIYVALEVL